MRVLEGLRLRVKDIEFERREIIVREGKGNKDRVTVLPENLITPLKAQLQKVRALHEKDVLAGFGHAYFPMCCATRLPHICCKRVTTFARCKSCWGMPMSAPP